MDITAQTFSYHLPRILDDLATCCFVSMDFEFSGIATAPLGPSDGTHTLQQRYNEVKRSADKYPILQIGLTICHEDTENATYTLKPYNLYLNPIIDKKLEVERDFSFQSSAVEFLLENKFRMDSLFKDGVHYVSREEQDKAMARVRERRDRPVVRTSLDVKETEYESLAFLKAVRGLVDDWLELGSTRESYLNIPPPSRLSIAQESKSLPSTLNRFQKRLVHQLIEVEYPALVTISKHDFIQIIEYDENREKALLEQGLRWMQDRIRKQTGFRWVAEALAGGDLSSLDPGCLIGIMSSSAAVESKYPLNEFSERLKQRLKAHRPVLVGHNLFTDLIYFCRSFFGPLPDRVEDFQSMAHKLFPVLMDTKYMATHDCGSINPRSSLSEINDSLAKMATPKISIHPQHSKYNTQKIDHEAGYDSLLTAQVFIKLSAQLRGRGASKLLEERILELPLRQSPGHTQHKLERGQSTKQVVSESSLKTTPQTAHGTSGNPTEKNLKQSSSKAPVSPKASFNTRFDVLEVGDTLENVESNIPSEGNGVPLEPSGSAEVMQKVNNGELIPRLPADFRKVYGNKLRVFGTKERVCLIG